MGTTAQETQRKNAVLSPGLGFLSDLISGFIWENKKGKAELFRLCI